MAQRWYCRVLGGEFGPLTFRQLARLVRDGAVTEGDEVRPDYQQHWQSAESVIGLYYMAFRAPGGTEDPVADASSGGMPVGVATAVEEEDAGEDDPAMLTLMEAIARRRLSGDAAGPTVALPGDVAAGDLDELENPFAVDEGLDLTAPSQLTGAIADAVEVAEANAAGSERRLPGWIRVPFGLISRLGGWQTAVRWGFSLTAAVVAANLAAWWLVQWSAREQLRFPSRKATAVLPYFPGFGRCGEFEYWLLFGHAVFFVGLTAFLTARWLANRAE